MKPHPYDLDAPLVSFVIGLSPFEGWQKAMMYVDCVISMPCTEACTEYLHVPASPQFHISPYTPKCAAHVSAIGWQHTMPHWNWCCCDLALVKPDSTVHIIQNAIICLQTW